MMTMVQTVLKTGLFIKAFDRDSNMILDQKGIGGKYEFVMIWDVIPISLTNIFLKDT